MSIVNKELVQKYCDTFAGRYLTVKKYKTLSGSELMFHLDNHWNMLDTHENEIRNSYRCGATGDRGETYSTNSFGNMGKYVFFERKGSFLLFKNTSKGCLEPHFVGNCLYGIDSVQKRHHFLFDNGINVTRKIWALNKNGQLNQHEVNVFERIS